MALSRLVVVSVVGCVVVVLLGVRTTGIKMTLIKQISFPLLQIPFPSSPLLLSHPSAPDGICVPTTPHPTATYLALLPLALVFMRTFTALQLRPWCRFNCSNIYKRIFRSLVCATSASLKVPSSTVASHSPSIWVQALLAPQPPPPPTGALSRSRSDVCWWTLL
jgi:hypothetical protein